MSSATAKRLLTLHFPGKDGPAAPIRVCEARMHTHAERAELAQNIAAVNALLQRQKQAHQQTHQHRHASHGTVPT
jgi:hypothetical protein